jgi:hypothetical protein
VRYIHLNPLRARIVSTLADLEDYDYCGHSALVGNKKRDWQNVEYVPGYFGQTRHQAIKEYCSFMESGFGQGRRSELTGGGLIRSLGGWSEVRKGALKGREHVKVMKGSWGIPTLWRTFFLSRGEVQPEL